jgi:hypothetical protein
MALHRHLLFTSLAIASLTLSCKDKPNDEQVVDAASSAAPMASAVPDASMTVDAGVAMNDGGAMDDEHRGMRGGPVGLLFAAAKKLDLKPEQKEKIEGAEKSAHAGGEVTRESMKAASKDLHTEILAEVKAGKIESSKLDPKYAAIEKLSAANHDKDVESLNGLYGALDATQRKAVVADARAKQAVREAKMAERMADMKGHDDGGTDAGKGPGMMMAKRSIEHLTRGIELDADQQKKVDAIAAKEDASAKAPDMTAMKKDMDNLLTAFEKDGFDAKKSLSYDAKKARAPLEREGRLLGQLLPILKPEQKDKLAAMMEKPNPMMGRRPGPGHRPLVEGEEEED